MVYRLVQYPIIILLGGLEHFLFFNKLGMSSSQLTFISFREVETTNQHTSTISLGAHHCKLSPRSLPAPGASGFPKSAFGSTAGSWLDLKGVVVAEHASNIPQSILILWNLLLYFNINYIELSYHILSICPIRIHIYNHLQVVVPLSSQGPASGASGVMPHYALFLGCSGNSFSA